MDTNIDPKTPWWRGSVLFFVRISGWVIGPIIISLFVGKALDKKFGTDPWIFISLTGLAFIVSLFGLIKESSKYMKSISKPKDEITENKDGN